jgi:hypothetical protein
MIASVTPATEPQGRPARAGYSLGWRRSYRASDARVCIHIRGSWLECALFCCPFSPYGSRLRQLTAGRTVRPSGGAVPSFCPAAGRDPAAAKRGLVAALLRRLQPSCGARPSGTLLARVSWLSLHPRGLASRPVNLADLRANLRALRRSPVLATQSRPSSRLDLGGLGRPDHDRQGSHEPRENRRGRRQLRFDRKRRETFSADRSQRRPRRNSPNPPQPGEKNAQLESRRGCSFGRQRTLAAINGLGRAHTPRLREATAARARCRGHASQRRVRGAPGARVVGELRSCCLAQACAAS